MSSGNDRKKVTQENFKISGVSELALGVADLERAERFYAGTLGLPVVERWSDAVWVMAGKRTRIGLLKLWRRSPPSAAGAMCTSHSTHPRLPWTGLSADWRSKATSCTWSASATGAVEPPSCPTQMATSSSSGLGTLAGTSTNSRLATATRAALRDWLNLREVRS
jgi:hypothetical protein